MFVVGHHAPSKGLGPASPEFLDLLRARTHMKNNNQILHGDQMRCEENADVPSVCRS